MLKLQFLSSYLAEVLFSIVIFFASVSYMCMYNMNCQLYIMTIDVSSYLYTFMGLVNFTSEGA